MKILTYIKENIFSILIIIVILISTNKICEKISQISFSPIINQSNTIPSPFINKGFDSVLSEDGQSLSITSNISLNEIENNSKVFLVFTPTSGGESKEFEMQNVGSLDYKATAILPSKGSYKLDVLVKGPITTKAYPLDTLNLTHIYNDKVPVNLFSFITSSDSLGNFTYTVEATNTHKENEGIKGKKLKTLQASFHYDNEEILFIDLLQKAETIEIQPDKTLYKHEGKHKLKSVNKTNWIDDLNISILAITEDGTEYTNTLLGPN